jgi:hypothetical protein
MLNSERSERPLRSGFSPQGVWLFWGGDCRWKRKARGFGRTGNFVLQSCMECVRVWGFLIF